MADVTSIVVKAGDTLSEIAQKYLSTYGKEAGYTSTYAFTEYLASLNDITDPDYIVVGQTINLNGDAVTTPTNNSSKANIKYFGLQSNTTRTMYVTWTWDKSNTESYQVRWYYATGDGFWFLGTDTKVDADSEKQNLYSAPENATKVKVKIKPISETKTVDKKTTSYWTAGWSTEKEYAFADNPPTKPSVPTVTVENYTLTAELANLDVNATEIEFQVVKNDTSVFNSGKATIVTSAASWTTSIAVGGKYKVRCRAVRDKLYSDWTEYSDNYTTIPAKISKITTIRAASSTSVYLEWPTIDNADSYDIEYATKKEYFDISNATTTTTGIETVKYQLTGLGSGEEYFFRVRAVNEKGESEWSAISSVIIGKAPSAPTTWSSTTTAIVGESLTLYWVHNSEDGSKQTYAQIDMYVDGILTSQTIKSETSDEEDEEEKTCSYSIDTSSFKEGCKIEWQIRTAGVTYETLGFGEASILRTIDVYAPPTLELTLLDYNEDSLEVLERLPFYVKALPGPDTQSPIGYYLSVTSNEGYDTVDNMGNVKMVNKGDLVYSKYFDIINSTLEVELSADNISLENNVEYTVTCTVSMNSGLTVENSREFTVSWEDEEYEPNAEIGVDTDTWTAHIRPFCKDVYGNSIEGVTLSVYRREFDGSFTELATNLDNEKNTFVTDPHPALDFARYRVVAKTEETGSISYYDIPGYYVGGKSIIIQWDEEWSSFDVTEEDEREDRPWTGSLLELPYNIDVADSYKPDIALVEYIGRKYPVSYYGTQLGMTSTWNVLIPKDDEETLYALRRLALWMGDAYVREPSGSGYWANVTVSFSQKHLETTIPVTLTLTRVAGGI